MARPLQHLGQVRSQGAQDRGISHSQRPIVSAGCYGTASLCSALMRRGAQMSPQMSVGLYYSTSTGNTETVAGYIADKLGIEDWNDIGDVETDDVMAKDAIIIGAPTCTQVLMSSAQAPVGMTLVMLRPMTLWQKTPSSSV